MKKINIILSVLFTNNILAINWIDPSIGGITFDIVSVNSTNLVIKSPIYYLKFYPEKRLKANEEFVLVPNCITEIYHSLYKNFDFIPVLYKNQLYGFQIMEIIDDFATMLGDSENDIMYESNFYLVTNSIHYVALSDTPLKVSEEDVEMIMVGTEWKLFTPTYFTNVIDQPLQYYKPHLFDESYFKPKQVLLSPFTPPKPISLLVPPSSPSPPFSEKIKPFVVPIFKWLTTDKYIWRSVVLVLSVSWFVYRRIRKRK